MSDVEQAAASHDDRPFPETVADFQRLFPDEAACAAYLENSRRNGQFACPHCGAIGDPFRFAARPHILRCRSCRKDTSLFAGTVMQGSHLPLTTWFRAVHLVLSQAPGMSVVELQRLLGLSRYETAFNLMNKIRAAMESPAPSRIGGLPEAAVEVGETWVAGLRGKGRGAGVAALVAAAVELRPLDPAEPGDRRAGRLRLAVLADRGGGSLCRFVAGAVEPGAAVVTDDGRGRHGLDALGYVGRPRQTRADRAVEAQPPPTIRLVLADLRAWLGLHRGVSAANLPACLNEYRFRFERRRSPFGAFEALLGICSGNPPRPDDEDRGGARGGARRRPPGAGIREPDRTGKTGPSRDGDIRDRRTP